ncbi:Carnitine O-acetyltransferase mitochondrial [Coemansia spiralis]|uniref:Carnitine O-acetyltransferase, mitochondrial n=2 Tax=Coemansia TaxID=4863 RepID=A0A9W8L0L8_9FUNG|nr:Carnitine O-acetyltransferase mitochondrial [Coemansia umbellata]KAJ2621086.1 Carnitine O-acetyltransferase mitochondrial [Coemansia sp. RSA 1358]KAJ2680200.1 Carnitine O-acetyltransferase mitochondrial [Coemansia spiralis]
MPSAPPSKKPADQVSGKLFEFQSQLPQLPVPSLEETLPKYLKTVEPLLSKESFAKTKKIVEEFGQSAQGKELQRRLEARAAEPGRVNWLEEWWNDLSYMGYRDPVVPYVSYFYAYKDDKLRRKASQRAAAIVRAAWEFRRQVATGELSPEMARTTPLCSHSYNYMFNATRIPKKPSDYEATYDLAKNEHITVARNNQFFSLQLVHDAQLLSAAEIESQLDRIIEIADSTAAVPVGILTSDNRDIWTDNYKLLSKASPKNVETLEKLQSSAFLLCLDDTRPVTREEYHRTYWHGNGSNRWFDKSLQFIVCDNGKAGFLGEHSSMDGTPTSRLNDYVLDQTLNNKVELGSPSVRSDLPTPEPLTFVTPPKVVHAIEAAKERFIKVINQHQLRVLQYEGFGKDEIKKLGFSPDGFVQMAIQLGYYKLYGKSRATYEAAATRKFAHGRTETCRSVSNESVSFCKEFENPATSIEDRAAALRAAVKAHGAYAKACAEGKGVDRHLLGLRLVLKPGEEKPAIFQDTTYAESSHWYLSTSQLSSEHFEGWGFSEVVPDGYGIAYTIRKDSVILHIAAMKNEFGLNSDHLAHYIKEALGEMRLAVLASKLKEATSKPKL